MTHDSIAVFQRLCFLEGEWTGKFNTSDPRTRYTDILRCSVDDGRIHCSSAIHLNGEEFGRRNFEIWQEEGRVNGVWEIDGNRTPLYVCEYEEERDEFLFNLADSPTSLDYRTIRRIDMMNFITMEQIPKEGTSAVETLQVEYHRTL
ncbi:MAG: hypothetical protein J9259_00915 [Thermoplasmata archaeon YP2-bin.285]|uniref:Uncharacterized protein n=1 Tax=Candidatus Sysuiplasma superficiale TaxID=2823368 RepID=A0A8J7YQX4_9ARCH|nr:hypothetical protein [Candidatus Sysuiplasma superficiale]